MAYTTPKALPSLKDIDPETQKPYTKSRLKKIKKMIEIEDKKKKKKLEAEKKKEKDAADKERLLADKIANNEFVVIEKDESLPKALKIEAVDASDHIGSRVVVKGWAETLRTQGALIFLLLRDCSNFNNRLQCVLSDKLTKTKDALKLHRENSVEIIGKLLKDERAEGGVELHADYWRIIGDSERDFSNIADDKSNVGFSLDHRHILLRLKPFPQIFKLRSLIIQAFRNNFFSSGFTEITPPCMVNTEVEGGSTLFKLDYFGKPAFLTQSSQLYLETVIASLGKAFCISPCFRAEKTRSRRHVTEYTHLEAEMPFYEFEDLLNLIERVVVEVCEAVVDKHGGLLKTLNPVFKVPKRPFIRMDHSEAIIYCRENNIYKDEETKEHFSDGDDIPEAPERKMTDQIGRPILLCRFPAKIKSFYMKRCGPDDTLTESVDLLIPGVGEIVGGSVRMEGYDELMSAFKEKEIDPSPYYWYTDLRKYGSVPHSGFGLGVERFLCWILGRDHIRDVCLYPRFPNRCSP